MTFRTRLFAVFLLTIAAAVGVVSWIGAERTRRAFERVDAARSTALVKQFQREFEARRAEVARRVEGISQAPAMLQAAIEVSRPDVDYSRYVEQAKAMADAEGLDFLELVASDGTIVSSAQWPARFLYKEEWVTDPAADWARQGVFLDRVQLPEGEAMGMMLVRVLQPGDKKLYVIGGERLDQQFVMSLALPPGMRVMLHTETSGPAAAEERPFVPLIERVRRERQEVTGTIGSGDDAEAVHALPLTGRQANLLGVLLVASSKRELAELIRGLREIGFIAGGAGLLFALVLAWWATARVTRPVRLLAEGARAVAAGNWQARVAVESGGEIGELAAAFNRMTHQLIEQRDRLLQAERVAAWRELARRLAHELKNPLFPLQITVENLKRARQEHPEQFEEVFEESAATLLTELANLKQIIGRFSDFAKMPAPELETVDVNRIVEQTMGLYRARLAAPGQAEIVPKLEMTPDLPPVEADPEQLGRALGNLVLNAIDAMPKGGTLTMRTGRSNGAVRVEVSDTGEGLTREECERLFTPYYTTKAHGTGLGLAIVQSVVSDHKGKIAVESEPGRGTTFRIDLRAAGGNSA